MVHEMINNSKRSKSENKIMMLQMGKPACARGFREIVFYDEWRLNFRNTGWYNKVLEKAGTYPVLGIKKMCIEAGLFMIGKPVLQSCNIFQEQFKHGRRSVVFLLVNRIPFTAFKNGVTHMNRTIFCAAYRQKGHD